VADRVVDPAETGLGESPCPCPCPWEGEEYLAPIPRGAG
jgi:hypothetical protein